MLGFCKQAPPPPQRRGGAMLAVMDVDDTLVLILERIDSSVSLIRAASTCRRWRRIIADAGFLRRFRSLNGPPVAGDYYNGDDSIRDVRHSPSFVPSSSIDARHFSLDFVVNVNIFKSWGWHIYPSWEVRDSRGSLLLMECIPKPLKIVSIPEFVVCEPLTRRHRIIPRIPDFSNWICQGAYLVDGDEDEAGGRIGISNFRVLYILLSGKDKLTYITMFTATAGGGGDTDSMWSEKAMDDHIASTLEHPYVSSSYDLGSPNFYVQKDGTFIARDSCTAKLSSSVLSLDVKNYLVDYQYWTQNFSVVDGGDGEPRIVTVTNDTLEVFARVDGQWGLENKVLLSKVTRGLPGYQPPFFDGKPLTVMRRGVGFVVLLPQEPEAQWPFSVDLKTMEVAPVMEGHVWKRSHIGVSSHGHRFCKLAWIDDGTMCFIT